MNENEKNRERKRRAGDGLSMGLPLKLGPDIHPIVRPQVPARHSTVRFKFYPNAKLLSGGAVPVCDIPEKGPCGSAAMGECGAFGHREAHEEVFELVHGATLHRLVKSINTI